MVAVLEADQRIRATSTSMGRWAAPDGTSATPKPLATIANWLPMDRAMCRGVRGEAGCPAARDDLVVIVGECCGAARSSAARRSPRGPGLVRGRSPGRGDGEHERLGAQRDPLAARRRGELTGEGDVDLAAAQRLDGDVRVDLADADVDPRVGLLEELEDPGSGSLNAEVTAPIRSSPA